ncbi:cx9c motif-containing protein 4 [Holotrichia oblita]|uniref:Cx9c motif-containing protein 4 n=2 Tax=Holotrichia oblita TaxID=644536 RepID=A0ACB9TUY1_HOLOL|nr:cx9c motif-containing protein 4 [Holotrichia oblita]KAI4470568.1 cx9c motif-containing protein 4 [Holotrichia oblita]
MKSKDPCKSFACKIQDCLKSHNYQESSCLEAIEDMKNCCKLWGEKSFVCGGFRIDETSSKKTDKNVK